MREMEMGLHAVSQQCQCWELQKYWYFKRDAAPNQQSRLISTYVLFSPHPQVRFYLTTSKNSWFAD